MRFIHTLVLSMAAMAVATSSVTDTTTDIVDTTPTEVIVADFTQADLDEAIEAGVDDEEDDDEDDFEDAVADIDFTESVVSRADNGLGRMELSLNGVYQGVLVETADGGVKAFDAQGKEVNLNAVKLGKRKSHKHKKHGLLHKIGHFFKKFEKKAWKFVKCAGKSVIGKCGLQFATCAEHGQTPAQCTSGLACAGKSVLHCL